VALSVSNIKAFPDNTSYYYDYYYYEDFSVLVRPWYYTGQSIIDLCPNVNLFAQPGTYAFSVQASAPSVLYVEVLTSNQPYPIPQSTDRVSCDQITYDDSDVLCFDEGYTYYVGLSGYHHLILPVPAGCHTISLSVGAYGASFNDGDLFCHPLTPDFLDWLPPAYIYLQGRSMAFHFISFHFI